MKKIPHDPTAMISVVDERDVVIGKAKRKEVHEKGLIHREVALMLIDEGSILVQVREDTGKYDFSAAGHVAFNKSYEKAIRDEAKEEIGIELSKVFHAFTFRHKYRMWEGINNRFLSVWIAKYEGGELRKEEGEVKALVWMSWEEVCKKEIKENATKAFRDSLTIMEAIYGGLPPYLD